MGILQLDDLDVKILPKESLFDLTKLRLQNPERLQSGEVVSTIGTLMMLDKGTPLLITMYKRGAEIETKLEAEAEEEAEAEIESKSEVGLRIDLPIELGEKGEDKREYGFRVF